MLGQRFSSHALRRALPPDQNCGGQASGRPQAGTRPQPSSELDAVSCRAVSMARYPRRACVQASDNVVASFERAPAAGPAPRPASAVVASRWACPLVPMFARRRCRRRTMLLRTPARGCIAERHERRASGFECGKLLAPASGPTSVPRSPSFPFATRSHHPLMTAL